MALSACAFDLGNTLLDDITIRKHAVRDIAEWLEARSVIDSADQFYTAYNRVNKEDDTPFVSHTFSDLHLFHETLRRVGARPNGQVDMILERYREIVIQRTECDSGVPEALRFLRARGITTALISNESTERVSRSLDATGLRPLFDHVFVSEAVGSEKPELHIFRTALDAMGVRPSNVAMLGDNDVADGACKELGISYVRVEWYRSDEWVAWEKGARYEPDLILERVTESEMQRLLNRFRDTEPAGKRSTESTVGRQKKNH